MRYKPCLCGDAGIRLGQLLEQKVNELGLGLLGYRIMPDKVYLAVSAPPTMAPHRIACQIKAHTSRVLRDEFIEMTRIPTLWTRAYLVFGGEHLTPEEALSEFEAWQPPRRARGRPRKREIDCGTVGGEQTDIQERAEEQYEARAEIYEM